MRLVIIRSLFSMTVLCMLKIRIDKIIDYCFAISLQLNPIELCGERRQQCVQCGRLMCILCISTQLAYGRWETTTENGNQNCLLYAQTDVILHVTPYFLRSFWLKMENNYVRCIGSQDAATIALIEPQRKLPLLRRMKMNEFLIWKLEMAWALTDCWIDMQWK